MTDSRIRLKFNSKPTALHTLQVTDFELSTLIQALDRWNLDSSDNTADRGRILRLLHLLKHSEPS
jgi:hypothetical protein